MDNQPTVLNVKGKEIPFVKTNILKVISIPNVPEEKPSFAIESIKCQVAPQGSESFAQISAITASMKTF